MKNSLIILSLLSVFLTGCINTEPKEERINYSKMAEELCDCLKPMVEFQQEIMNMVATGRESEVIDMRDRAMQIEQDGDACVTALEQKYGVIEGEEMEAKATEALREACPEYMAILEGGSGNQPLLEDIPVEELEEMLQQMEQEE